MNAFPPNRSYEEFFCPGIRRLGAACVLIAPSGLRLMTLGNCRGLDGLRVRDFPEMKIEDGTVEFEQG